VKHHNYQLLNHHIFLLKQIDLGATTTYKDLLLTSLTSDPHKMAIRDNAQVRVDTARVSQAEAMLRIASSHAYPKLSAQAFFGGPTPEARTSAKNHPASVTPASLEGDLNLGHLGISARLALQGIQPIYTFDKLRHSRAAAAHLVTASKHRVDATAAGVVLNVHRAFWTIQLTRAFVAALDRGEQTLAKVLKRIEELLDNDSVQVTENDRLRLRHALFTLAVRRSESNNAMQTAHCALNLLLGRQIYIYL